MLWQFVALVAPAQALPPLTQAEIQEIVSVCSQPAACAAEHGSETAEQIRPDSSTEMLAGMRESVAPEPAEPTEHVMSEIGSGGDHPRSHMRAGVLGGAISGRRLGALGRLVSPNAGAADSERHAFMGDAAESSGHAPHAYAYGEPPHGSDQACRLTQGRARSYARNEVIHAFEAAGYHDVTPIQGATVDHYIARRSETENYLVKIDFTAVPKVLPGTPPCDPAVYVQLVVRIPPAHAQAKSDDLSAHMRAHLSQVLTALP